jgi:hypothetical protein
MQPVPTETMRDMLEAKNTRPTIAEKEGKKDGVKAQRLRLQKDPEAFTKQLVELELEYARRLEKWQEEERQERRLARREAKKDAHSKKKREPDLGTERALELCIQRLKAIKEETK